MAKVEFELNHAGAAEILMSAMGIVEPAAQAIAANARANYGDGVTVTVETTTTDRAKAFVVVKGPGVVLGEVRDGAMTRAATSAGVHLGGRG